MEERSLQVLIGEDDTLVAQVVSRAMTSFGHHVCGVAKTGTELLSSFTRLTPDLLVVDYAMPIMDGIEAIRHIDKTRPTPTILMSAFEIDPRHVPACVVACLRKPIQMVDLQKALIKFRLEMTALSGE